MSVRIVTGDCRDVLATMPDESVHCVVTSPPYWGLRDYGVDGQIGLEASVAEHITILRDVFREVRRVLRKDGTCWVNYGDAYVSKPPGASAGGASGSSTLHGIKSEKYKATKDASSGQKRDTTQGVGRLKPKDLIGLPWRLAFALQDDGWWLRSDIIWAKPNPMPESVTDRPTRAHEYVFLLTKAARYWYDADAIADDAIYAGKSVSLGEKSLSRGQAAGANVVASVNGKAICVEVAARRNARTVWEIATAPFSEAHFATFPPALAERCIKAGCPVGGTVLDPFSGAGTTGLVADRLQRNAILIELNPAYAAIAERRIHNDAPLLSEVQPHV